MNVKQVEFLPVGDFPSSRGKSQGVRRIVEQRVIRNLYFVIEDAGSSHIQPDGRGIADEVHLMPPLREFKPEFGRDDAAASVRGVARDADPHGSSISRNPDFCRYGPGSDGQYYFADVFAALQSLVSQARIPQGES